MGESTHTFRICRGTVEEVLESYREQHTAHGNDLDLLAQAMMLIQAGHYREAVAFASQVQPPSPVSDEPPATVDLPTAQAAFLAAAERARPLHEQAAFEIEGRVEGSVTMAHYFQTLEVLRSDPTW